MNLSISPGEVRCCCRYSLKDAHGRPFVGGFVLPVLLPAGLLSVDTSPQAKEPKSMGALNSPPSAATSCDKDENGSQCAAAASSSMPNSTICKKTQMLSQPSIYILQTQTERASNSSSLQLIIEQKLAACACCCERPKHLLRAGLLRCID